MERSLTIWEATLSTLSDPLGITIRSEFNILLARIPYIQCDIGISTGGSQSS